MVDRRMVSHREARKDREARECLDLERGDGKNMEELFCHYLERLAFER
jgi:hypothetical protein